MKKYKILIIVVGIFVVGLLGVFLNKNLVTHTGDSAVVQGRYMDVESYVKNSISTLSPVKEQLGGTFYVTKITTKDGKGVVEYEDGHNAYTASFTYSVGEEGKPLVTNFVVR